MVLAVSIVTPYNTKCNWLSIISAMNMKYHDILHIYIPFILSSIPKICNEFPSFLSSLMGFWLDVRHAQHFLKWFANCKKSRSYLASYQNWLSNIVFFMRRNPFADPNSYLILSAWYLSIYNTTGSWTWYLWSTKIASLYWRRAWSILLLNTSSILTFEQRHAGRNSYIWFLKLLQNRWAKQGELPALSLSSGG